MACPCCRRGCPRVMSPRSVMRPRYRICLPTILSKRRRAAAAAASSAPPRAIAPTPRPVSAVRAGVATSTKSSLPHSSYRTRSRRADRTHRTPMPRVKTRGGSRVWTPTSRRGRNRSRPRSSAPRRPRRVCPPVTPARHPRVSSRSAGARVPTHRSRASCRRARSPVAPTCRRPRPSRMPRSRRRRHPNVPRSPMHRRRRAPRMLPPNGPRSPTPHSRRRLAPRKHRPNGPRPPTPRNRVRAAARRPRPNGRRFQTLRNRVRLAHRKHQPNGPRAPTPRSRVRLGLRRLRQSGVRTPRPRRGLRRLPSSARRSRTPRRVLRKVQQSGPHFRTRRRKLPHRLHPSDLRSRTHRHGLLKARPSDPLFRTHRRRLRPSGRLFRTRRRTLRKARPSDPRSPTHRRRLRHVARSPPRIDSRPKALRGRLFRRRPPPPVAHRDISTGTRRRSPTARRRGWPAPGPNKETQSSRSARRCPNLLHRRAPPRRSSRFHPSASKHRWGPTARRRGWPRQSPMSRPRPRSRPNRPAGGRNFRRPLGNSPKALTREPLTRHAPDRSTPGLWPSADRARPRHRIALRHWTRAARPVRSPRRAARSVCPCRTTPHRRRRPPKCRARTASPEPTG